MDWYYADEGNRSGPVSEEQLRSLLARGTVNDGTLVWHEGMKDWAPLGSTGFRLGVPMAAGPAGMVRCAECGRSFPQDEVIAYQGVHVCGQCKGVFFQRVKEGGALPGEFNYGGFWIRVGAKILDNIILYVVNLAGLALLGALLASSTDPAQGPNPLFLILSILVSYAPPIVYTTFFVGRYGATPGKMAAGLKVVRPNGDQVTYLRAFGRYFAEMLSLFIFFIGYIMAAFDDEKRALHDRICDTRVVRTR